MPHIIGILILLFIAYHYRLDQASGVGEYLLYMLIALIVVLLRSAWRTLN